MNDNPKIPESLEIVNPGAFVKHLALESITAVIASRIEETEDEAAKPILERLLTYIDMIKKADASYSEMIDLIVDTEFEYFDRMGYSYTKDSTGNVVLASIIGKSDSMEETTEKELTEADYYMVLDMMHDDFRKDGYPEKYKPAYSRMKTNLRNLINEDTFFGMAMVQARPYLSCAEGIFLTSQFYLNIQLLLSIKAMLEPFGA